MHLIASSHIPVDSVYDVVKQEGYRFVVVLKDRWGKWDLPKCIVWSKENTPNCLGDGASNRKRGWEVAWDWILYPRPLPGLCETKLIWTEFPDTGTINATHLSLVLQYLKPLFFQSKCVDTLASSWCPPDKHFHAWYQSSAQFTKLQLLNGAAYLETWARTHKGFHPCIRSLPPSQDSVTCLYNLQWDQVAGACVERIFQWKI